MHDLRLELESEAYGNGKTCKAYIKTYQKFESLVRSNKENFEPDQMTELDQVLASTKSRIHKDMRETRAKRARMSTSQEIPMDTQG